MTEPMNPVIEKIIDKTVENVYEDGLKPTVKELGGLAALPIRIIKSKLSKHYEQCLVSEYNLKETEARLANKLRYVEENNIISPASYIAIPALQAISYSMDSSELRDMYASLLATAMNKELSDKSHPSFVETIRQMSPFDAQFFNEAFGPTDKITSYYLKDNKNSKVLIENLFSCNLDPRKISFSLSLLARLGLVTQLLISESDIDNLLNDKKTEVLPIKIQESPYLKDTLSTVPDETELEYGASDIELTDYGLLFREVCCS